MILEVSKPAHSSRDSWLKPLHYSYLFHNAHFETGFEFCSLKLDMHMTFESMFQVEYSKSQDSCCLLVLDKIDP